MATWIPSQHRDAGVTRMDDYVGRTVVLDFPATIGRGLGGATTFAAGERFEVVGHYRGGLTVARPGDRRVVMRRLRRSQFSIETTDTDGQGGRVQGCPPSSCV